MALAVSPVRSLGANRSISAFPLDHRRAPLLETLHAERLAALAPFATPGHKGGAGAGRELRGLIGDDVFAADVWLQTEAHARAARAAEGLAAATWGADRSYFLVNGATGGNHAALLAMLAPGDEVVIGRDVHQSLLTALILTGARPVYVAPRLHPESGVGLGVAASDVAAALEAHPAAKLVALVSPTYWGVAADVGAIAAVAHGRGVPLYVDAAWGAHLGFHLGLPPSPLAAGADAVVVSPHKLLSGLSQAAMLHVRGPRVDAERVAAAVAMTQSTSPLLPVLASLDACRRQMALAGEDLLGLALELAEVAKRRVGALPGLAVRDAAALGLPAWRHDPTRLVVDVRGLGMTGFEAERALRERFGVAPELSDLDGVVCLVTLGDTPESIDRLVDAFVGLAEERAPRRRPLAVRCAEAAAFLPGCQEMTPREAFFAPCRAVPLAEAVGAVAAELVVPYPPGIPVVVPGEVVTAAKVASLREGLALGIRLRGAADPGLRTMRVVDR